MPGGSGWDNNIELSRNVNYVGHVYTRDHNVFNGSTLAVLNVNRDSMARTGDSPPTRVLGAAGAGACLLCDAWDGLEEFIEPGREVLCVACGEEVAALLPTLTPELARRIGERTRLRMLSEHAYEHRARELRKLLVEHLPAGSVTAGHNQENCSAAL